MAYKYSANQIVLDHGGAGVYDTLGNVITCAPIKVKDVYYLFYASLDAGALYTGSLATSKDGIGFTKDPLNPIIPVGAGGSIDEGNAIPIAAIYIDEKKFSLKNTINNIGLWYVFYNAYTIGGLTTLAWAKGRNANSLQKQGVIITPPAGFRFSGILPAHVEYRDSNAFEKADWELEKANDPVFFIRYNLEEIATGKFDVRLAIVKLW